MSDKIKKIIKENAWKKVAFGNEFSDKAAGAIVKNFTKTAGNINVPKAISGASYGGTGGLAAIQKAANVAKVAATRDAGKGLATGAAKSVDMMAPALTVASGGAAGVAGTAGKTAAKQLGSAVGKPVMSAMKNVIRPTNKVLRTASRFAAGGAGANAVADQVTQGVNDKFNLNMTKPEVMSGIVKGVVGDNSQTRMTGGELKALATSKEVVGGLPKAASKMALTRTLPGASISATVAGNPDPAGKLAQTGSKLTDTLKSKELMATPEGTGAVGKLFGGLYRQQLDTAAANTQRAASRAAKDVAKTQYHVDRLNKLQDKGKYQFSGPARRTVRSSGDIAKPTTTSARSRVINKQAPVPATKPKAQGSWLASLFSNNK